MLWISVDRDSKIPIIRQIYEQLRSKILKGDLHPGEKLPSTREMASNINVSRNVILQAYEQLTAEGYVESREGSGTYVAEGACYKEFNKISANFDIHDSKYSSSGSTVIDFRSGLPALDIFPKKKWGQLLYDACINAPCNSLGYGNPAGCIELRQAIAHYLQKTRGIHCHPDQIIITTGAVQALQLVTKLLLSSGMKVVVEDPSNYDLQRILTSTGAELYPVPVDEYGINTRLLPAGKDIGVVYVTPSHQFPIGGILPVQRRIELVKYAGNTGCYIIEDDYDSEFRYEGAPVSSLQELEPERVIYIGTFSKILFPALRIGYIVLPGTLAGKCRRIKRHSDFQTPYLEQLVLAGFIEKGYLERHISKMKKVYVKRRKKLIECLDKYFPGNYKICGKAAGLHLVADFTFKPSRGFYSNLKDKGVRIYPVEIHSAIKDRSKSKFILGYGNLSEDQIEEGVRRIKEALILSLPFSYLG